MDSKKFVLEIFKVLWGTTWNKLISISMFRMFLELSDTSEVILSFLHYLKNNFPRIPDLVIEICRVLVSLVMDSGNPQTIYFLLTIFLILVIGKIIQGANFKERLFGFLRASTSKKIYHMFPHGLDDFVGRKDDLNLLNDFYRSKDNYVFGIRAWGGVGKTALIKTWARKLKLKRHSSVFAWSFYGQSSNTYHSVTSDEFFEFLFTHFNITERIGTTGIVQLVKKLAGHILVLDGFETLQSLDGEFKGTILDGNMKFFLDEISSKTIKVVITTRFSIEDLKDSPGYLEVKLDNLNNDDSLELFKKNKFIIDEYVHEVINYFQGHVLSLKLIIRYVNDLCGGDIRGVDSITNISAVNEGEKINNILKGYCVWIKAHNLDFLILQLISIIDGPSSKDILYHLYENLNSPFSKLVNIDKSIGRLLNLGLIYKVEPGDLYDNHPLIKDFFSNLFKELDFNNYLQVNELLFKFNLKMIKSDPKDVTDLNPARSAILYGTRISRYQECVDIYWKYIKKGDDHFSTRILGAFGYDLSVLKNFYIKPWDCLASEIQLYWRAQINNWVGLRLRALGRIREAIIPYSNSLTEFIEINDTYEIALNYSLLCELYFLTGQGKRSIEYGEQALSTFLEMENYTPQGEIRFRTKLAQAYFQYNKVEEAEGEFILAEKIYKDSSKDKYAFLQSNAGFRYHRMLIYFGKNEAVLHRTKKNIELAKNKNYGPLSLALNYYMLSVANLHMGRVEESRRAYLVAASSIYKTGVYEYLAYIYLLDLQICILDNSAPTTIKKKMELFKKKVKLWGLDIFNLDLLVIEYQFNVYQNENENASKCYKRLEELSILYNSYLALNNLRIKIIDKSQNN